MITRNLINAFIRDISTGYPTSKDINGNLFIDGYTNSLNSIKSGNFVAEKRGSLGNAKSTFVLGSSDTPVSRSDYNLLDEIDYTDFTINNASCTDFPSGQVVSEDTWLNHKKAYTQTWTYNGESEIVIKEIGLISYFQTFSGYSTVLFAREVLNSPITVKTGDTFTVSMTLG